MNKLKQGTKVKCNGYDGVIVRHYESNTYEIRLPGGVVATSEFLVVIDSAYVDETPLYEIKDSEGGFATAFDLMIVANVGDQEFTLNKRFKGYEAEEANELLAKILDSGAIKLNHWAAGTPWDYYKIPQTYGEEKVETLAMEAA